MSTLKQFVLPFAVTSKNREKPFSAEAEAATVFALSELERRSDGENSNKSEEIVFILKIGYPLWLITRDKFTYVFDGLNRIRHNWTYCETSEIVFKNEDLKDSFRIREEYIKFLVNYQKSFCQSQNDKELLCEGLIANHTLLEEIGSYRKEATEVHSQMPGLLWPVLEEKKITKTIDHIETLQLTFKEDIEKLRQLIELVSKTTKEYSEGFNFELKAVEEEAEAKIKAEKEIINPKTEKITINYKKQIERLKKSIDKEQQPLEKQKSRIEKTIKETEKNIEQYNKQAKIQSQRGNKRSEESLKKKLKKEKQKIDELQKQQKKLENQLETLIEQNTNNLAALKSEFDREIQKERQPITTLETIRDKKLEKLKLEKLTHAAIEWIEQLVNTWEQRLTNMKLLGLKADAEQKNNTIIYVPFYITAYNHADSKEKRYLVFSPSTVSSLGFSSKLKGMLGRAKIKDLLNKRFETITYLGEKLQDKTTISNKDLETQIETLIQQKNNLLDRKTLLKEGLLLLKEEGWLSESEHQIILSTI